MDWRHDSNRDCAWLRGAVRLLVAIFALMLGQPLLAQTVTTYVVTNDGAVNGTTPCTTPLIRNFTVADSFTVADVDLGVLVTHTWRGDLQITLVSPNGTRVQLTNGDTGGVSGDNFNVILDDAATQVVNTDSATGNHSTTAPPFQNRFRPRSALSAFNGQNSAGTWRLEICDLFPGADDGDFRHAELYLRSQPTNVADLSLTKQLIGSAPNAGGSVSWRLTVFSAASSTATATGITVLDTLPAGFTFTSASGTGTFNAGTGVWNVGSLAPGSVAVITITGTITSPAGTTVVNTAQITASSLFDPDSVVNNGVTTEDDYAASTFVVQSARAAGIPPQLSCPAGFSVFDWSTTTGWPAGSTDNTYAFANFGNIRFRLVNDGVYQNIAAYGGQSPTLTNAINGGTSPADLALSVIADQPSLAGDVDITITLPRAFSGLQFTIFDVDFFANQFADRVEVVGSLNGSQVLPVLTNGNANFVQGNVAIGDVLSGDADAAGNLVVTFNQPVDTIVIRYGNHTTAPANPGQQGISLHDLIVCSPFADLAVSKVSTLISDPVNGTTNPKLIPGAIVEYSITVRNVGTGTVDASSLVLIDVMPPEMAFAVGTPVTFTNGTPASGLNAFNAGTMVTYSQATGGLAPYTYTPTGSFDPRVRGIRIAPTGTMAAASSATSQPNFTIRFRAQVQ